MADIQEYKCPNCGGGLAFNSTSQNMKCPYCDTELSIEALKAYDQDLNTASEEDKIKWETSGKVWQEADTEGLRAYVCQSCGGQIIGDANMGATKCPYCDNPVVMMGQFSGDLKPDALIPFKVDKNAAKAALIEHYKSKPFTPDSFISDSRIEEIKGVYVPFWLFDAESEGGARYKATTVRRWSDQKYNYTETKYYSVMRRGGLAFEKIPFDGSSQMPDELMESVEPFDFSQAVDFQTAYMAGYIGDRYDVPSDQCTDRVNERIRNSTLEALRSTVTGYDTVNLEDDFVNAEQGSVTYAMYPVWMLTTNWNGQKFTFAMNGQTGKMVGDVPIDKGKVTKKLLTLTAIIGGAAAVVQIILRLIGML